MARVAVFLASQLVSSLQERVSLSGSSFFPRKTSASLTYTWMERWAFSRWDLRCSKNWVLLFQGILLRSWAQERGRFSGWVIILCCWWIVWSLHRRWKRQSRAGTWVKSQWRTKNHRRVWPHNLIPATAVMCRRCPNWWSVGFARMRTTTATWRLLALVAVAWR